ncbi:hypothetical protein [Stenoxybacter acetivorans]|uniref:hypothetical protein n=1 Tax=Stenoxybacter acetivorans TaxID=422441 RepID=UPI0012EC60B0|nr:hypothetical protein [Stenoxybacter acetivorans]
MSIMVSAYKLLLVLLLYPQPEWLAALNDISSAAAVTRAGRLPENIGGHLAARRFD